MKKSMKINDYSFLSRTVSVDFDIKKDLGLEPIDEFDTYTLYIKHDKFLSVLKKYLESEGFEYSGTDNSLYNILEEFGIIDKLEDNETLNKMLVEEYKYLARDSYQEYIDNVKEYEFIEEDDYEDTSED